MTRVPLDHIKNLANKRDVPYQTLHKSVYLYGESVAKKKIAPKPRGRRPPRRAPHPDGPCDPSS